MDQKYKMTDVGDVKVHNNAIKAITELTATKVKGVVRINKSQLKKFLDNLGICKTMNILEGIRVDSYDTGIKISLDVVAAYGFDIPQIATKIQDDVKQAVENMTGISSVEVDVNVVSVEQEGG